LRKISNCKFAKKNFFYFTLLAIVNASEKQSKQKKKTEHYSKQKNPQETGTMILPKPFSISNGATHTLIRRHTMPMLKHTIPRPEHMHPNFGEVY
jgi:hypothetical protein